MNIVEIKISQLKIHPNNIRKEYEGIDELAQTIKENGIMQENVSGARVVKAFVQEKTEQSRFDAANQSLVDTQFNVQMMLSFQKQANLLWSEIFDIVKQNSTTAYEGSPQDDAMERLLRSRRK